MWWWKEAEVDAWLCDKPKVPSLCLNPPRHKTWLGDKKNPKEIHDMVCITL